jgi:Fe-S cluster biogenesis protein NfuA
MGPVADPQDVGARIEGLLGGLAEHAEPKVVAAAEELAELLMDMYGDGLARIVMLLRDIDTDIGAGVLRRVASDEVVSGLLVLHDLHPDDTATRAAAALESVRPYLGSHAGDVELIGLVDEPEGPVLKLALKGSCDGCPSSAVTVQTAIEGAIATACPEVVRVDVDGVAGGVTAGATGGQAGEPAREAGGLPLLQIGIGPPAPAAAPVSVGWVVLDPPPLRPGQCQVVSVSGHPVLVALPAGAASGTGLVAYSDGCASCGASLAGAELRGDVLSCPSCAAGFDVRHAGRALTGSGSANGSGSGSANGTGGSAEPHLEPLPLVERGGGWKLALPKAAPVAAGSYR